MCMWTCPRVQASVYQRWGLRTGHLAPGFELITTCNLVTYGLEVPLALGGRQGSQSGA